jgi:hypothetical protein
VISYLVSLTLAKVVLGLNIFLQGEIDGGSYSTTILFCLFFVNVFVLI